MENTLVQQLFKFRWPLSVASLLFIVFAAAGLQHAKFDGSTGFFFGENHPNMKIWHAFSETFGSTDKAMLMLKGQQGENLLASKEVLHLVENLTEELALLHNITSVESIQNYQYTYSEGDDLIVDNLYTEALQLSDAAMAKVAQVADTYPALKGRLVSDTGDTLVIVATGDFRMEAAAEKDLKKLSVTELLYDIKARVQAQHPDLDVYANGNIVGNSVTMRTALEDMTTYIPLMYLIIYGLLALLLRSILSMLTIAFTATFCTVASIGIACWMGMTLAPLSLSAASIIVITTVAHCVHLVIAYLHNYRNGMVKVEALKESYRINLQPIFFTSVTTALGFLSMNISEMQPARDLGNIVAIGVSFSFLFSLTLLPTFLLMMPVSNKKQKSNSLNIVSDTACHIVLNHPKVCLLVSVILAAILGYSASLNVITERMTENIKYPDPFRYSTDAYDEALGGVYSIQYKLESGNENGISDPQYLQHLEAFTQYLRAHPDVSNVYSYVDVIKRLNKNMHGDNPEYERLPITHDEAAQYLLLYKMSLPQGFNVDNQISFDQSSTRLVINIETMDSVTYLQLQKAIYAWQQDNLLEVMQDYGTSDSSMWAHLSINVLNNSIISSFTALFLISIVLMGILRSVKYGFISLAPNMLPGIAGFGFWAFYSGEINLALMSVLSITIGIVVDDTVHFLSKYIRAKKEQGLDAEAAIRYAFEQVGPAITLTTIILTAGFASLTLSPFLANSNMGAIIAFIIFSALVFDFFLLPAILLLVDRKKTAASV